MWGVGSAFGGPQTFAPNRSETLFLPELEGLTEVVVPKRPPRYPHGRPQDVRPHNGLFSPLAVAIVGRFQQARGCSIHVPVRPRRETNALAIKCEYPPFRYPL